MDVRSGDSKVYGIETTPKDLSKRIDKVQQRGGFIIAFQSIAIMKIPTRSNFHSTSGILPTLCEVLLDYLLFEIPKHTFP